MFKIIMDNIIDDRRWLLVSATDVQSALVCAEEQISDEWELEAQDDELDLFMFFMTRKENSVSD